MRRTSTTASLAAGIRAHHWQWNPAPIFADEYAVDMLSLGWRLIVKNRLLNWLVVDKLLAPFHPIHTENILRVRYAEDCLNEAYHLNDKEKQRLVEAIRAVYAIPFVDDIEDYIWEAIPIQASGSRRRLPYRLIVPFPVHH